MPQRCDTSFLRKKELAEPTESAETVIATAAAEQKQDPDNAAAVTAATESAVSSTAGCQEKNDDDPCAAAVVSFIAGASATTGCC